MEEKIRELEKLIKSDPAPDELRTIAKQIAHWHIDNCTGDLLKRGLALVRAIVEYANELEGAKWVQP